MKSEKYNKVILYINQNNELDELINQVSKNIRKLLDEKSKEEIVVDIDRILDLEKQILVLRTKE